MLKQLMHTTWSKDELQFRVFTLRLQKLLERWKVVRGLLRNLFENDFPSCHLKITSQRYHRVTRDIGWKTLVYINEQNEIVGNETFLNSTKKRTPYHWIWLPLSLLFFICSSIFNFAWLPPFHLLQSSLQVSYARWNHKK